MKRMWSLKQIKEFIKATTKDISTLVDKNGHERFIEGDIDIKEITGVTKDYGKWSLSGSHLLIVICCSFADTTAITSGTLLSEIELPEWIFNKIIPLYGSNIEYHNSNLFNSAGVAQSIGNYLRKDTAKLQLRLSALTLTDDRSGRFAFDLLIDND